MSDLNINDYADSIKKRHSWGKYVEKNPDAAKVFDETGKHFGETFEAALNQEGPHGEALNLLFKPADAARTELKAIATLDKNGWVKNEGVTDEAFAKASKTYKEEYTKLEGFLLGKEKVKLASGEEISASGKLIAAHAKANEAVGKVKSGMDSLFSMAKVEGMGFTAKHNLNKFNVFNKEARIPTSNKDLLIRGGSMAVGATMTIDALARGKDKEGEPRGGYTRLLEGLAGLGLVGGSVLAGHAR